MNSELTISQLLQLSSPIIIDIRHPSKYLAGHIPSAKSINAKSLLENPSSYLDKRQTYYLYCDFGFTSKRVVERLNAMGYSAKNIIGGYKNYLLRK